MVRSADQTQRPVAHGRSTAAGSADVETAFAGLAALLRVRPELQQICRFGAQWASGHGPEERGWAPFHIVTAGACVLDVGEKGEIRLLAGDVAMLPHGSPHTTRALPTAGGPDAPIRVTGRRSDGLVVKSNVTGEGDVELVCGRLRFEQAHHNLVLAMLPPVIVLSRDGCDAARVRNLVDVVRAELDDGRPGAAHLATTLASAIMILVLRSHLAQAQVGGTMVSLLTDRHTARLLAALLDDPGRAWALTDMADLALTSRATLVRLFRRAVGAPPLAFLTDLRLTLARARLRATHAPLALIAEEVGYTSETAFSRAYHRRFGLSPGLDRAAR